MASAIGIVIPLWLAPVPGRVKVELDEVIFNESGNWERSDPPDWLIFLA
jgi:hypothetical protein